MYLYAIMPRRRAARPAGKRRTAVVLRRVTDPTVGSGEAKKNYKNKMKRKKNAGNIPWFPSVRGGGSDHDRLRRRLPCAIRVGGPVHTKPYTFIYRHVPYKHIMYIYIKVTYLTRKMHIACNIYTSLAANISGALPMFDDGRWWWWWWW